MPKPPSMRRGSTLVILLSWLSLQMTSISADDGIEQSAILGVGGESCSVYMTTYEHNPGSLDDDHDAGDEGVHHEASHTSSDYIHWLQGYLTAYNKFEYNNENIASQPSVGGMLYFLYRRCSETPEAAFYTVLPALLERIGSKQER